MKSNGIKMEEVRSILVIRLRFIGDCILSTPFIHSLKKAYPRVKISYLAEQASLPALMNHPDISELLPVEKGSIADDIRTIKEVRKRKFDLVIDTFGNPRSALIAYASGALFRLGWEQRGRSYAYTHFVKSTKKSPDAIDVYNDFLPMLGIKKAFRDTSMYLSPAEVKAGKKFLDWNKVKSSKKVVGIHPGASWPAKMWPKDRFAKLADMLVESGKQVVIFSGPKDRSIGAEVCLLMRNKVPFADNLPLRDFGGLVSQLDCFITNDNGPMHVAAALKVPLIGIFGPGDPSVWFPYKKNALALKRTFNCWPCRKDHCDDLKCMEKLSVNEVYKASKKLCR